MVSQLFTHLVTLVKSSTGNEVLLMVRTSTGNFSDLMTATHAQRKTQKLFGYEIFESLPC